MREVSGRRVSPPKLPGYVIGSWPHDLDEAQVDKGAVKTWNMSGIRAAISRTSKKGKADVIVKPARGLPCGAGYSTPLTDSTGTALHGSVYVGLRPLLADPKWCRLPVTVAAAHEFGHILGLDHEKHACALMNPNLDTVAGASGQLASLNPSHCRARPGYWYCRIQVLNPAFSTRGKNYDSSRVLFPSEEKDVKGQAMTLISPELGGNKQRIKTRAKVTLAGVLTVASLVTASGADAAVDAQLKGDYGVRLSLLAGPGAGTTVGRTYGFSGCAQKGCPTVKFARETSTGSTVTSTLSRVEKGVYEGVERQKKPVCANGDPATSRTGQIHIEVKAAKKGRATKIAGTLHFDVVGCDETYQDAKFTGKK